MKNLVVLISGNGTNLQSIIDAVAANRLKARIVAVISSNDRAYGLTRAQNAGIKTYVLPLKDYATPQERDERIIEIARGLKADYLVLAGYLGICSPPLIAAFKRRIINIHPALLPSFGGKGFFGLNVHKAVIEAGEKVSGATVHYVDEGTDTGEIIESRSLEVLPNDTPETLQKRILTEIEQKLLVDVLTKICEE